ncbi:MAG: hypothetical protein MZU79_04345 [Anaerotruncus sp.]|nr:hypothetical protein [Anaerotruncus sp.]
MGNFLRFPVKAAANGGGAFMIPYFVRLPAPGHPDDVGRVDDRPPWAAPTATAPRRACSTSCGRRPASKYLGALGIVIPFVIVIYYNFIESWCLGYSWFSITGKYFGHANREAMGKFLRGFQGVESNEFFSSLAPDPDHLGHYHRPELLLSCTRAFPGASRSWPRYGMPLLFVFGIILVIRVLTLGTPDPSQPELNVATGMGYIWNPDFSQLGVGLGLAGGGRPDLLHPEPRPGHHQHLRLLRSGEAGYHPQRPDHLIDQRIRRGRPGRHDRHPGRRDLLRAGRNPGHRQRGGLQPRFPGPAGHLPEDPLGQIFGGMFFFLLFIAGITSSVAMTQPAIAFLEDEFKWKREKAVIAVFSVLVTMTALVIAFFKFGFLDELDFWAGTFGLVVFAAIEVILFSWVFGLKKGWQEMHKGADLKVPRVFKFILTYVTPIYLLVLLGYWFFTDAIKEFLMKDEDPVRHPYLWGARVMIVALLLVMLLLIRKAWNKKGAKDRSQGRISPALAAGSAPWLSAT